MGVSDLYLYDTLAMAVERADRVMYRSKQSGRDLVLLGELYTRRVGVRRTWLARAAFHNFISDVHTDIHKVVARDRGDGGHHRC